MTFTRFPWAATAVTLLGLGFAVMAAGLAVRGRVVEGFVLLSAAGLADLFDGWVARRTGTAGTAFGVELDSLVDMASFGVVPMVLLFAVLGGEGFGGEAGPSGAAPGLLALLLGWGYAACCALRLARFNAEAVPEKGPARTYRGLPVTYAALIFPVAFAVAESVPVFGTGGVLGAAALVQAGLFVSAVPVPKPRGLAYPFFLLLAVGVAAYLLLVVAPGGAG